MLFSVLVAARSFYRINRCFDRCSHEVTFAMLQYVKLSVHTSGGKSAMDFNFLAVSSFNSIIELTAAGPCFRFLIVVSCKVHKCRLNEIFHNILVYIRGHPSIKFFMVFFRVS